MNHYHHLTPDERELIFKYRTLGLSISETAKKLGRNKSTISRELKRNSSEREYSPSKAQLAYKDRRLSCKPKKRFDDPELYQCVKSKFLEHQWSPEEIAGRLRLEDPDHYVSSSTIYRAIYSQVFDPPNLSHGNRGVIRKLRHRGKSRHTKSYEERRGKIRISHPLSERPEEANRRERLGDWEADTVAGSKNGECLVTLVDRKSRYLVGGKAKKKTSIYVNEVMIRALENEPLHTITPDRGKEFSRHSEITEKMNVEFYFPDPHHPWSRGTNENTNGLLREYFPKGQDLAIYSEEYIQQKFDELNHRPRKCLGYRTPYEVYFDIALHLV